MKIDRMKNLRRELRLPQAGVFDGGQEMALQKPQGSSPLPNLSLPAFSREQESGMDRFAPLPAPLLDARGHFRSNDKKRKFFTPIIVREGKRGSR
jgi:hypothetical protein